MWPNPHCPLVSMISCIKLLNKIENLRKWALRFILSNFESSYDEFSKLFDSCVINVKFKRNLYVEVYANTYEKLF